MRVLPLIAAAALAAACSGTSTKAEPTPTTTAPAPSATTSTAAGGDPYTALAPPQSPGIGDFAPGVVNHAYVVAQGLLAEAVLEEQTLLGTNSTQLGIDLSGAAKSASIVSALSDPAKPEGLRLRPRFGKGVTLAKPAADVVRSSWGGAPVGTPDGGAAMRITWDGSLRYHVVYGGKPVDVAFALKASWVFLPKDNEVNGVELVTAVPGEFHAAPQLASCTAKGLLVPVGAAATDDDFGSGPYPTPAAGQPCPA
jgi:hypothetical protein